MERARERSWLLAATSTPSIAPRTPTSFFRWIPIFSPAGRAMSATCASFTGAASWTHPARVRARVQAIGPARRDVVTTRYSAEPGDTHPVSDLESVRQRCADSHAGKVTALLVLGVAALYGAPQDVDAPSALLFGEKSR